jgi:hypothetical protein
MWRAARAQRPLPSDYSQGPLYWHGRLIAFLFYRIWCVTASCPSLFAWMIPGVHDWSPIQSISSSPIVILLDCYFSIAGYTLYSAISLLLTINLPLIVVIREYSWLKSLVLFSSVFFVLMQLFIIWLVLFESALSHMYVSGIQSLQVIKLIGMSRYIYLLPFITWMAVLPPSMQDFMLISVQFKLAFHTYKKFFYWLLFQNVLRMFWHRKYLPVWI